MSGQSQSGGLSLLRKTVAAIILIPLAVVIIAFAVANRHIVTVSLDPFSSSEPAAVVKLPLFLLIIALLIVGVIIGGAAAWLRQGRWRRAARRLEREVETLRTEIQALKPPGEAHAGESLPPRLQLKPPPG